MSFIAKIDLDGESINVLHCSYRFIEVTDSTGRPVSVPQGGKISLMLESTGSTSLFDWMISPVQTKSGKVTFFRRDALSKMNVLEFTDAWCVDYYETFDHTSSTPMKVQLTISAPTMKLNGSEYSSDGAAVASAANETKTLVMEPEGKGDGAPKGKVDEVKKVPEPKAPPKVRECKGSGKGGSTKISIDDTNKVLNVNTKMEFSGPDATEEYAKAAKQQIEETWSGKMKKNGEDYKVVVTIDTKVNKSGTPTPGYDQIIVDKKNTRMSQTLFGAGPGNQHPDAASDKARPRRIAHEYGHTLGIKDGYKDDKDKGSVPIDPTKKNDIMSETWPDKSGVLPHPHQDHYDTMLSNQNCDV